MLSEFVGGNQHKILRPQVVMIRYDISLCVIRLEAIKRYVGGTNEAPY